MHFLKSIIHIHDEFILSMNYLVSIFSCGCCCYHFFFHSIKHHHHHQYSGNDHRRVLKMKPYLEPEKKFSLVTSIACWCYMSIDVDIDFDWQFYNHTSYICWKTNFVWWWFLNIYTDKANTHTHTSFIFTQIKQKKKTTTTKIKVTINSKYLGS